MQNSLGEMQIYISQRSSFYTFPSIYSFVSAHKHHSVYQPKLEISVPSHSTSAQADGKNP
jgi:hypothetical protein